MTAEAATDDRFRVEESTAAELARRYDTPLYVFDEEGFRTRIRRYLAAFRTVAPDGEISFASKANSALAVLAIAYREGCAIDVASEGEFRAALAAGVPAERCRLHGNNKRRDALEFAIRQGIGKVYIDHFGEIEQLAEIGRSAALPELAIRLAPGVDPITHAKISTGQADTKFGFNIADGSAERAVRRCLELKLPLVGFHCHVGSQLLDPEAQRSGGELIARFAGDMADRCGFETTYLNVGGGLGVRYLPTDVPVSVEDYCRLVVESVQAALKPTGLKPQLTQEPGRSLAAESGVTLYRVGVVKSVPARGRGTRTYVCVDGGLSDNPRPALYGSKYQVERIGGESSEKAVFTVSGSHCETDMLFEDVELPSDIAAGDLLQVLCTGAYNSSMASNYNRYSRPATVLLRSDKSHCEIQRRETWDEMLSRESMPQGLSE